MPSASRGRTAAQCEYLDGSKRCRRRGAGHPAFCPEHQAVIAAMGQGQQGFGEKIAGVFERMSQGKRVTKAQQNGIIASIASVFTGRPVSLKDVDQAQRAAARGDWSGVWQGASPDGGLAGAAERTQAVWQRAQAQQALYEKETRRVMHEVRQRAAQQQARQGRQPPRDPHADARTKIHGARQVMGFSPTEPLNQDLLKARFRELAKKHHPDRGGSTEAMAQVNAAMEVLLEALEKNL